MACSDHHRQHGRGKCQGGGGGGVQEFLNPVTTGWGQKLLSTPPVMKFEKLSNCQGGQWW